MSDDTSEAPRGDDFQKRRFDRAAETYGDHSAVQRQMAMRLASLVPEGFRPRSIIEFGCGTGHLTENLLARFSGVDYLATDAAERMLAACRSRVGAGADGDGSRRYRILDARAFELGESFDLAASNALVQWFPNLTTHLASVARALTSQGLVMASGFCRDHFPELNAILGQAPFSYPQAVGHEPVEVAREFEGAGFEILFLDAEAWRVEYRDARHFLEGIQATGASRRPDGTRMSRNNLRLLLRSYEDRFSVPGGVFATWRPWFCVARHARSRTEAKPRPEPGEDAVC